MEYIALANALMAGLEILMPKIQSLAKSGDITAEQQQELKAKYDALRAKGDAAFTGPEWEIEPS